MSEDKKAIFGDLVVSKDKELADAPLLRDGVKAEDVPEEYKEIANMSKGEIVEALLEEPQPSVLDVDPVSIEDLKKMGVRDISEFDEKEFLKDVTEKSIQVQRTLHDPSRNSSDSKSPRDYLDQHLDFLVRVSPGKNKKEIAQKLTVEHAKSILKTTAKMELPNKLVKKHVKNLKKKYS